MWQQAGRAGRRARGARDARRAGRPARPVPRAPSRGPVRQAGRGRRDRPREPVRPGAAPPVRRARAADRRRDVAYFGAEAAALERMGERGELRAAATPGTTPAASRRTAQSTSARARDASTTIVNAETGEVIGTADEHRAFATLHPAPSTSTWASSSSSGSTSVRRRVPGSRAPTSRSSGSSGDASRRRRLVRLVLVTDQVVGFVRKLVSTNEVTRCRSTSPQHLETRGALAHDPRERDRAPPPSRRSSCPARSTRPSTRRSA